MIEVIGTRFGIGRIDQAEKKTYGFYVRLVVRGRSKAKFFGDRPCGGRRQALLAAQLYRDGLVDRKTKAEKQFVRYLMAARRRRKEAV